MNSRHTVRSFDKDLSKVRGLLSGMGRVAKAQFDLSLKSLRERDLTLAARARKMDGELDSLSAELESFSIRIIALRQPVADDLRTIIASIKVSVDLERIGDYAADVARRVTPLQKVPRTPFVTGITRIGDQVECMLSSVLEALLKNDVEKALQVRNADEEIDNLYTGLFRELLTYMMEDPRHISACTHVLFIAKDLERIGDHITNIAESLYYQVEGRPLSQKRPKADKTPTTFLRPEASSGGSSTDLG